MPTDKPVEDLGEDIDFDAEILDAIWDALPRDEHSTFEDEPEA